MFGDLICLNIGQDPHPAEDANYVDWHRGGPKAAWRPPDTITIQYGMTEADTLCSLAHEFGHFSHGDHCGHSPRAEARADRYAAHILIDPHHYRQAEEIFGPDPRRLAAELGVTVHLIKVWRTLTRKRDHPPS
ncbi:ImmA/IrrE family metallo-endopeptidase [Corynebacterium variabile]|uniref:ImmA/IrrE family metallo-endopeptidase n=1 Tax=Corynebacterium variabile TaxID=1727 RepID=UPI002FE15C61